MTEIDLSFLHSKNGNEIQEKLLEIAIELSASISQEFDPYINNHVNVSHLQTKVRAKTIAAIAHLASEVIDELTSNS